MVRKKNVNKALRLRWNNYVNLYIAVWFQITIMKRFPWLREALELELLNGREVAVLKRRKHKREFKDCQPGQKRVAVVEKDWASAEVAVSRRFSVCEF